MEVIIKQLSHREIWVNEKRVFKDFNGNWIIDKALTHDERVAFRKYIYELYGAEKSTRV